MTGIFIKNLFFSWRQVFNEQLILLCLERCSWENELIHLVFFDYLKKTNTNFNTKDHSRQEDQKRGAFENHISRKRSRHNVTSYELRQLARSSKRQVVRNVNAEIVLKLVKYRPKFKIFGREVKPED